MRSPEMGAVAEVAISAGVFVDSATRAFNLERGGEVTLMPLLHQIAEAGIPVPVILTALTAISITVFVHGAIRLNPR